MNDLLLIIAFSLIGSLLGIITGLIPGLHTNNIAILLLMLSSYIQLNIYFCILIVAASISHTFLDIIPSTFIGAPEEDTALVVLPAHSMLLEGRGYEAVFISAISSLFSIIMCFLLLIPFRFILSNPINLYKFIECALPFILIGISVIVILTSYNKLKAFVIFLLSGFLGLAIIDLNVSFIFSSSPIFPALAGLFGVPALVYSYKQILPKQEIIERVDVNKKDILSGVTAGGIVSILPGVSAAIATILALIFRKERKNENTISILSATNTATNFFVLATLFIILKARSGFAIAIRELIKIEKWNELIMPYPFNIFLIAVIISSIIAYYSTKHIGKFVAMNIQKISYPLLLKMSLVIILSMVFIFSGFLGMLILFTSSLVGILCLKMRVRRSLCMGVLLLPLIIKYFSQIL